MYNSFDQQRRLLLIQQAQLQQQQQQAPPPAMLGLTPNDQLRLSLLRQQQQIAPAPAVSSSFAAPVSVLPPYIQIQPALVPVTSYVVPMVQVNTTTPMQLNNVMAASNSTRVQQHGLDNLYLQQQLANNTQPQQRPQQPMNAVNDLVSAGPPYTTSWSSTTPNVASVAAASSQTARQVSLEHQSSVLPEPQCPVNDVSPAAGQQQAKASSPSKASKKTTPKEQSSRLPKKAAASAARTKKRGGAKHSKPSSSRSAAAAATNTKKDDKWLAALEELKEYKNAYGNCVVPRGYAQNPRLASWVAEQRYVVLILS